MADVAERCPEHVWTLSAVVVADEGLTQQYVCDRCQVARVFGPGEAPPGSPDFPT